MFLLKLLRSVLWKVSLVVKNLQSSTKCFNIFQLTVLILRPTALLFRFSLTALISVVSLTLTHQDPTDDRRSKRLASEHSGAAAKEPNMPQEMVENKTELKGEWILNLHLPGGQELQMKDNVAPETAECVNS